MSELRRQIRRKRTFAREDAHLGQGALRQPFLSQGPV
jgi:hypothetical protein